MLLVSDTVGKAPASRVCILVACRPVGLANVFAASTLAARQECPRQRTDAAVVAHLHSLLTSCAVPAVRTAALLFHVKRRQPIGTPGQRLARNGVQRVVRCSLVEPRTRRG